MKSSISRAKLFKACRRAYYFKYIEDLEPAQKSEALTIGSNYHDLLEDLYKNGEFTSSNDYSKERAMATAYKKYIYPKFKMKYVESWEQKPIGSKHILFGRVDGIAEDGCLVEHKTTSLSDIQEQYEYELLWDEQILAYMYITGARKVYYTVCRKPTIRQKQNETDEDFYYRMLQWYDEDTDSKIRVMEISRTDEEVMRFVKEFKSVCDSMDRVESGEEGYYKNTQYCNCWGRRCEYSSICLNYNPEQEYIEFVRGGRK